VTAWTQQRQRPSGDRGGSGIEEGAGNFGSLTPSKSKSSGYGLRTGLLGVL
jgi:hypothetical protein